MIVYPGQVYNLNLKYFNISCIIQNLNFLGVREKCLVSQEPTFEFILPVSMVDEKDLKYIKENPSA